jgi:hypothetical protein
MRAKVGQMMRKSKSEIAKLMIKYCVAEVNLVPQTMTQITIKLAITPTEAINIQRIVMVNKK